MGKCKCGSKPRIVSSMVQLMNQGGGSGNGGNSVQNVCANPICGQPKLLSLFAPLIYDEIGINLCTTFDIGTDIATTYPTVTNATIKVIGATYEYGADGVLIEAITGQPNCYVVTLSGITVQFAMNLYDAACRLVDTLYPTAVYLPPDITAETYDEDTNPTSVELAIFAPYGLSYDTTGAAPAPIINDIGFGSENNMVRQGLNLYHMAKLLDFSTDDSTATVGLTLVLQSLYYAGYQVTSQGRIDVPKGSIITPDNSDCMRFVAGDLLDLAIKPLDLSEPPCPNHDGKGNSAGSSNCPNCVGGSFGNTASGNCGVNGAADNTVVIPGIPDTPPDQEVTTETDNTTTG